MPYPFLSYAQVLQPGTIQELDTLVTRLKAFLAVAHNEDGTLKAAAAARLTAGGMDLDYLGAYAPVSSARPVYNDGDIVIASDGIAYMCVVDGTVTPPEPWPGIGISTVVGPPGPPGPPGTSAAVDATYWLASAHASLPYGKNLGALSNGYVKNFGGSPLIVGVIPLAEGGTGATTAPNARTNLGLGTMAVQNADNVNITNGSIGVGVLSAFTGINSNGYVNVTGQLTADTVLGGSLVKSNADVIAVASVQGATIIASGLFQSLATTGVAFAAHSGGWFSGDGRALTNLNAANLATGLVATARLGSGTANASTFLRGDQTWATMPDSFPSGLIVLSMSPCPVGWTRVTTWDGSFLRVGVPGTTGGADTHSHGSGTLSVRSHSHGGSVSVTTSLSGTIGSGGDHNHGFSGSGSSTTGAASGPTYGGTNQINPTFTVVDNTHTHSVSMSISGTTNNGGAHSHSFSGSGSGSGAIAAEAPPVDGATAAVSSLPPYMEVYLCQKN